MANNGTPPRSLFFLRAGWNCFLGNREVVVLLSLLTAMITLAIPSPMRDLVIGGDAATKALLESPEVLREALPALAFVWVVLLAAGSLISVVLARTIVLGGGRAMDGGWQSLVWRGFRVAMKALAALFFIILFALPSFFLVGLIANQAGDGMNMILAVALMLWVVVVATIVTGAYYAAVLAESTDRPSGIVKGWDALKGKLMDLCGAILILWVLFLLVAGIIDPIITFGTGLFLGEGLARALSFSITTVLGGILGFVLMAATFFVLGLTAPAFLGPPAPIPTDPDDD